MKQKIELYREVMELEPGSRVFFPLAKLLMQDERPDEAVEVLRSGLQRRPDHVEARLLLVELLSHKGDAAGLDEEMERLEQLFTSYPAFWEEWSGRLSRRPESKDAAIAGRFFSLSMQGKAVSWADVIDEGLRAFTGGAPLRPRAVEMPDLSLSAEPAPRRAEPTFAMPDLSLTPVPAAVPVESPVRPEAPGPRVLRVMPAPLEPEEPVYLEEPGVSLDEREPSPAFETVARTEPPESEEAAAVPTVEIAAEEDLEPVDLQGLEVAEADVDDAEEAPIFRNLGTLGSDEDFNLRTRSMAEILAEQGDYAGALEIYRELEADAVPAIKVELGVRIAELEDRLRESEVIVRNMDAYDDVPGSDGTKLVDLLESLAKRLEARAR